MPAEHSIVETFLNLDSDESASCSSDSGSFDSGSDTASCEDAQLSTQSVVQCPPDIVEAWSEWDSSSKVWEGQASEWYWDVALEAAVGAHE